MLDNLKNCPVQIHNDPIYSGSAVVTVLVAEDGTKGHLLPHTNGNAVMHLTTDGARELAAILIKQADDADVSREEMLQWCRESEKPANKVQEVEAVEAALDDKEYYEWEIVELFYRGLVVEGSW